MLDIDNYPDDNSPYEIENIINCPNFKLREPCKEAINNIKSISNNYICPFWCNNCYYWDYRLKGMKKK